MDDDNADTAVDPGASAAAKSVVTSFNNGDSFKEPTFILDKFLNKHLRYTRKSEITTLCLTAENSIKKHYKDDSCIIKIRHLPLYIVGDLHGDWRQLLRIFNACGAPGEKAYLFLGDYVDRGNRSVEVACLLICLKIKFPHKIYLLRGNHETDQCNSVYGFYEEIQSRFNHGDSIAVYKAFNKVFRCFPLVALVADHILCMHGGISPKLNKLSDLAKIKIPLDITTEDSLQLDLLWADPSVRRDVQTFEKNVPRGCSKLFSVQDVYATCERLNLKLIVRAHQPFNRGFGFFAGKRLLTLFGAVDHAAKGSYAGVLHLQLEKAVDKKGKSTGKLEIQAGIILFRPTTKETKGKHKFLIEFEELGTADVDTEDETTQLERMGKMPTEEEIREAMKD
uniref:Serine/threonine-protein phosphatase n=1 Tax=Meloidogyne enterolobii TaxID=390850 RepID=A0A6V7XK41_MELEN|nr:unnamed protein product [Meloidogyne enterolobii]